MVTAVFAIRNTLYGKLTQLVTKGPYTHCGLVIDGVLYHVSPTAGLIREPYAVSGVWEEILVKPFSKKKVLKFIETELGSNHDWFWVLRALFPTLKESEDAWFSSEWLTTCLIKGGYKLDKKSYQYNISALRNKMLSKVRRNGKATNSRPNNYGLHH